MSRVSPETCRGRKADGSPCKAPGAVVDPSTGYCWSHDPGRSTERAEAQRRGGAATAARNRRHGLGEAELPSLDGPKAAERWCEIVARAVATGRVPHNQGQAVIRAVSEFLRAHEAGSVQDRLEALQQQVRALKDLRVENGK